MKACSSSASSPSHAPSERQELGDEPRLPGFVVYEPAEHGLQRAVAQRVGLAQQQRCLLLERRPAVDDAGQRLGQILKVRV